MTNSIHLKILLAFLIFITSQIATQAQELFTLSPNSNQLLSTEQSERVLKVNNDSLTKTLQYVTVGSLKDLQINGILNFTIPNYSEDSLRAIGKYIEVSPDGDYFWWGEIAPTLDSLGDGGFISYFYEDGLTFGHIEVREKIFEFFDLTGTQILVEYDTTMLYNIEECGIGEGGNISNNTLDLQKKMEPSKDVLEGMNFSQPCEEISLLVLYSQNALNNCISLGSAARMAVGYMNSAIKNSGIANTRIQIVGIEPLFSFSETNNLNNDANNYGDLLETKRIRDSLRADFVILLTHSEEYGSAGTVKEIKDDSASVFALSHISYTSSKNNLAHEIGHLLGCHHLTNSNYSGDDKAATLKKGSKIYRTIVVQKAKRRIPYYSNPNVEYLGKKTGASDRFNAQQIFDARCQADNFYPDPLSELSIHILGSTEVGKYESITLTSSVSGGLAPYNYEWRTSPDGFTWSPILQRTNYFHFSPPHGSTEVYYIQLTVTDLNNVKKSTIRSIEITDDHPFSGSKISFSKEYNTSDHKQELIKDLKIAPNPFVNEIIISFVLQKELEVRVELLDFTGRLVQMENSILSEGINQIPIIIKDNSDFYTCRITAESQILSEKIVRIKQ